MVGEFVLVPALDGDVIGVGVVGIAVVIGVELDRHAQEVVAHELAAAARGVEARVLNANASPSAGGHWRPSRNVNVVVKPPAAGCGLR